MASRSLWLAICVTTLLAACGGSTPEPGTLKCADPGAPACGAHGTCDDASGAAACACADGYTGSTCDACAGGFQDHDQDGTCQPTCAADTCGAHGTCDDASGAATCTCAEGYTGPSCDACAAGFQDHDGDGACEPACAADTCSAHGTCDDASGAAICTCADGFTGSTCDACAEGLQDHDGDGTCQPSCADDTCGAHGTCDDASGAAACTCADGYTGPTCDACAAGFQDHDGDGICQPTCDADTCSVHGTCDDASGAATCQCASGWTGADCGSCAPGTQDHDGDGVCAPDCSTLTCDGANHEACSDASGTAACGCAHGYTDVGGSCTWTGVLADPGFDDTPAGAWTVNAATLASSTAVFDNTSACGPGPFGSVSQDFSMPPYDVSGPMSLTLDAQVLCNGIQCAFGDRRFVADVSGHRAVTPVLSSTFAPTALCLGEAAYQPDANLSIFYADRLACRSFTTVQGTLASADIQPDATCPPLGSVLDGAFTDGGQGWTLSAQDANDANAYGEVVAAGPIDGTAAGHTHVESKCSDASLATRVSIPLHGAAVELDVQASADLPVNLTLDGVPFGSFVGTGATQHLHLCLPAGLQGWVHDFAVTQVVGGSCFPETLFDIYVDNLAIVDDASCTTDPLDPGAEAALDSPVAVWSVQGSAGFTQAAEEVHSGAQALKLSVEGCGVGRAVFGMTAPVANASGGPALKFWANVTGTATVNASGDGLVNGTYGTVPPTNGWEQKLVCIPPDHAGTTTQGAFVISGSSDCGGPTTTALFDDVQPTTDPSCPSY